MPELRLAFWNVQNLFDPGVVDRGPQSAAERDQKIAQLFSLINGFFGGAGPDLLGLTEVGSEPIFDALHASLNGNFMFLWEPPRQSDQTGIAVLARLPICADLEPIDTHRPTVVSRPRVLLARITLAGVDEPFLLAVNHSLWEETHVAGYEESRPKTSHDTSPPVIFDQLLVSSRVLRNGPVMLNERSVGYMLIQLPVAVSPGAGRTGVLHSPAAESTSLAAGLLFTIADLAWSD